MLLYYCIKHIMSLIINKNLNLKYIFTMLSHYISWEAHVFWLHVTWYYSRGGLKIKHWVHLKILSGSMPERHVVSLVICLLGMTHVGEWMSRNKMTSGKIYMSIDLATSQQTVSAYIELCCQFSFMLIHNYQSWFILKFCISCSQTKHGLI